VFFLGPDTAGITPKLEYLLRISYKIKFLLSFGPR
jgi:hypothetical protein